MYSSGQRTNRVPCSDAECENLHQRFLSSPKGALFRRVCHDPAYKARQTAKGSLIKGVQQHRLAWNAINSLTGRSQQAPRQCPASANAIATQLVKNKNEEGSKRPRFARRI